MGRWGRNLKSAAFRKPHHFSVWLSGGQQINSTAPRNFLPPKVGTGREQPQPPILRWHQLPRAWGEGTSKEELGEKALLWEPRRTAFWPEGHVAEPRCQRFTPARPRETIKTGRKALAQQRQPRKSGCGAVTSEKPPFQLRRPNGPNIAPSLPISEPARGPALLEDHRFPGACVPGLSSLWTFRCQIQVNLPCSLCLMMLHALPSPYSFLYPSILKNCNIFLVPSPILSFVEIWPRTSWGKRKEKGLAGRHGDTMFT